MMTIIKIAWRNVWRNKLRSSVVITAIALGLWAGLFMMALVLGLNEQRVSGAINSYLSHVQIHHPDFLKTLKIKHTLQDADLTAKTLKEDNRVKAFSTRINITGMAANSSGSYGVQLLGINPHKEANVTSVADNIIEGTYFANNKKNAVVVGKKLADKLNLKLKSKLVVTFQDADKNMISILFKVRGIYKTSNSIFDESTIFVQEKELSDHINLNGKYHEMIVLCHRITDAEALSKDLKTVIKQDEVQTWEEIAPELGYAQQMMSQMVYIFMFIILLALSFSIVNTMLMAVLERKKELGVLMAIGMNKRRIFTMIAFETVFISMVAAPLGIVAAYGTIHYFGIHGIDLSVVAEGLENLGVGAVIFPFLPTGLYIEISLLTLIVAFLSSLFPARRALKLNPSEAVRAL